MSNKIKQNNFKIKTYDGFEECDYWYTELYYKNKLDIDHSINFLHHYGNLDEVYFDSVLSYRDFLIYKDQNYFKDVFETVIYITECNIKELGNNIIRTLTIEIYYYFYNKIVFDDTINLKNLK